MKILTVDIGGTYIKYACMTEQMEILSRGKMPTPQEGREALIEALGRIYDSVPGIEGISISMPGIIDTKRGYCVMGGALSYNADFYLRDRLAKRCPVRIHMENDAKCAVMAEAATGSLQDVQDGFALLFGTMIGGGYVKDGKLQKGKHFSAGEVSYLITDRDALAKPDTVWGNRCSTLGLCRLYAGKKGLDVSQVDGVMVFDAVARGEAQAVEALQQFTREIAVQIFNIQTVLDPERFVIGGGISAQSVFLEYIRKNLDELYAQCPYQVPRAQVVACKYQNDANLYGALQCFLQEELQ